MHWENVAGDLTTALPKTLVQIQKRRVAVFKRSVNTNTVRVRVRNSTLEETAFNDIEREW